MIKLSIKHLGLTSVAGYFLWNCNRLLLIVFSRGDENLPETEQLVSALPDVTVVNRCADTDQFVCLACDGIFDVFLNEELADYINNQLKIRGEDLESLCGDVIDTSLHKVSTHSMKPFIDKHLC